MRAEGAILAFCRDPAAAVQIAGLFEAGAAERAALDARLAGDGALAKARVLAREPGLSMLRQAGLGAVPWPDDLAPAEAVAGAGLVVTGTSDLDEATDLELWRAAAAAGVTSIALLDSAENLNARFTKGGDRPVLPDRLAVADEAAARACQAFGVPADRVVVGPDLRRLHVAATARRLPADTRRSLRAGWGVAEDGYCVLYASECGREAAAGGRPSRFDEVDALEGLIGWAAEPAFAGVCGARRPAIVVRPHPRDTPGKYDGHLVAGPVPVGLDASGASGVAAALAADLVAGLTTSLLDEAVWVGTAALCLVSPPLDARRSILAAHQPVYLPGVIFFNKMALADRLVVLNDVQLARGRSWQTRNRVRSGDDAVYLSVPVMKKGRSEQRIDEALIASQDWQRRHVETLRHAYGRRPHFQRHFEPLAELIARPWQRLAELNVALIRHLAACFGIETPLEDSREHATGTDRNMRLIGLSRSLGADAYVSNVGSATYIDEALFARHGVTHLWQHFTHPVYEQGGPFVTNLSAVDILFNLGPEAGAAIRASGHLAEARPADAPARGKAEDDD